jgi:hypothetical protein
MSAPLSTTTTRGPAALGLALTLVAVDMTLTTAYIHLTLGGALFTLNAAGYAALAAGLVLFAIPHPLTRRLAWLPRLGLAGYTATTIAAYLVIGPYFTLGWIAKAIEVGILIVVAADLARLYGSPAGLGRAIAGSLRRGPGRGPLAAA